MSDAPTANVVAPVLRADAVRVTIDDAAVVVDLSFTTRGDHVALLEVGGSGLMPALMHRTLLHRTAGGDGAPVLVEVAGGVLEVAGKPPGKHVGTAGLAPFEPRLLMDWRVDEYLAWSGRLLGVPKRRAAERAAATLERLHIAGHRRRELRLLTRAERRAIVIAAAVVHEPDVVICDMPLSRLDTPEQGFVLATLQRARAGRRSIVSLDRLALHGAVAEVLRSASDVVVLKDGRLLLHTSPAELFVGVGIFEMSVAAGGAELAAALRERGIQSDGGPPHFLVRLPETCQPRDVLAEAARVGSAVTALVPLLG